VSSSSCTPSQCCYLCWECLTQRVVVLHAAASAASETHPLVKQGTLLPWYVLAIPLV